jgi:hypothetical protein
MLVIGSQPTLPDPHVLATVPGTPRKAFQRLIKRCSTPSTPRQLRTTTVILEALEKAGLAKLDSDDHWLLAIDLEAANMVHSWFQLHGGRDIDRCGLLPTTLIKVVNRSGGEHYVTISSLHLPDPFAIHAQLFFFSASVSTGAFCLAASNVSLRAWKAANGVGAEGIALTRECPVLHTKSISNKKELENSRAP